MRCRTGLILVLFSGFFFTALPASPIPSWETEEEVEIKVEDEVAISEESPNFFIKLFHEVRDDVVWSAKTVFMDARDILISPYYITKIQRFPWKEVAIGVGTAGCIAGTVYLDDDIRSFMRKSPDDTARSVQIACEATLWTATGSLYVVGLVVGEDRWRHAAITGLETYCISYWLARGIKKATGRARPASELGPFAWRVGGDSFISDTTAPMYCLAACVSHAFDDKWWAAVPSYLIATGVGIGRMGMDRHWASDILGSAAVGILTAKIFLWLHDSRDKKESGKTASRLSINIVPFSTLSGSRGLALQFRF